MNYPRIIIPHDKLQPNQRVYVKDLDVFGRVSESRKYVNCESPMPTYKYNIMPDSILYNEAIGDRDPHDRAENE
jgi:hypothetical protein